MSVRQQTQHVGVCVGAGSDGLGHTVTCPGILQDLWVVA